MKLILLGTAGFIPTDRAQTACFMLPEAGVLLDAGSGLYRMHRNLQTDTLDIYLTHAHGDHTRGLVWLFASYFLHEIQRRGVAASEDETREVAAAANHRLHATRVHAAQDALDSLTREYEPYQMDWRLAQPQEELPGGGSITSFEAGSSGEIGFRLDWPGRSLAYVTDTTARPGAPYLEHIRGVDVLLHECNGPDRLAQMMAGIHHSSTSAVARVAAEAGVGRLVLVHSNPVEEWSIDADLDAARGIFPKTVIGRDGMEIEF